VTLLSDGGLLHSVSLHRDVVTCVAITETGCTLITGSADCTVALWAIQTDPKLPATDAKRVPRFVPHTPRAIAYGHDQPVTAVAASYDFEVVLSASLDGTCIMHTLRRGTYVRSFSPMSDGVISWLGISSQGDIVCLRGSVLHVYSLNGNAVCSVDTCEKIGAVALSASGDFVATGSDRVTVRHLFNLQATFTSDPLGAVVRCLSLSLSQHHLFVGLDTGHMITVSHTILIDRQVALRRKQKEKDRSRDLLWG